MDKKEALIKYWHERFLIKDERVLTAFKEVQREKFISKELQEHAYDDEPLPIGCNQTISQPTTVVMMVQALDIQKGNKILEIGAGSGYKAAILAELTGPEGVVYTVEYEKELATLAQKNLQGRKNIQVIHDDGSTGLPEHAPFDRIIISAACPSLPHPLLKQLNNNGVIVAPVGSRYEQSVLRGIKKGDQISTTSLGKFMFVPLKGKCGFAKE